MAITYDSTNNVITVTEGTEGSPNSFSSLWAADKAGTRTLWTGTPTINITLTTQIKPTDEVALKIDFVLAGTSAGAGDTLDIVGTDKDGNAQTETLDVSAGNGTYTTTKWFKTITDVDCNGFNDGTLTIQQGQWGVVWKEGANQFMFDARLQIGDGATETWFADKGVAVEFSADVITVNYQALFLVKANGRLRFGVLIDATDKTTRNGVFIRSMEATQYIYGFNVEADGQSYIYSTTFVGHTKTTRNILRNGKLYNSLFTGQGSASIQSATITSMDVYNCIITDAYESWTPSDTGNTMDTLRTDGGWMGVRLLTIDGITIKNVRIRDCTYSLYLDSRYTYYIVNPDVDSWTIYWYLTQTGKTYRQYEFDLTATDKNNNPLNGAAVTLKDKDGNTVFTTTTNASGQIATQTVSRGYYDQTHGNTLQDYSPHKLLVSKASYQTYEITFTLAKKTDWTIKLTKVIDIIFVDGKPALNLSETDPENELYTQVG